MRRLTCAAAAGLLVAACAEKPVEKVEAVKEPVLSRADCYTVVLFDEFEIKPPAEGVPPEHARFLGKWERGAWNGEWCHDLLVTEVAKGGVVKVVDMHAPYEPWGQPASAFQRIGTIDKEGVMRFAYGTERVAYRIEDDGKLVATRSGIHGDLEALLVLNGYVPLPAPRPANLAANTAAPQTASKAAAPAN